MSTAATPVRPALPNRVIGAWLDRADSGTATAILLALFVAAWTAFQVISYASLDLHPDLVEIYAWSRHPSPGYYKHPPLGGLMAAGWFAVFPVADWSFHLLAMTNAAAALFVVDRIARRWVSGDKRVLVLLFLLLTPFYQFHGQRFASNQTLLLAWPLAVLCFLRAFETRTILWSAAAGAACALAMLGKYYSIYLIAALPLAALLHPARWSYLKSPSPWVSMLAGFAVLSPHLWWLATTGFQPFGYAYAVHGGATLGAILWKAFLYLIGAVAYVAVPVLVWLAIVRPGRALVAATLWPADPDRRMLVHLLVLPLLIPAVSAPFVGVELTSLWTMQAWFLLPVVLLAPPEATISRPAATAVAGAVAIVTLVVLAAAPGLALLRHWEGNKEGRAYYAPLAEAVGREWVATTGTRLPIVIGDADLGAAIAFYHPDHPDSVPGFTLAPTPWISPDRLLRDGYVAVCRADDRPCLQALAARARTEPEARTVDLVVTRTFFGDTNRPAPYRLLIVPPQSGPRSAWHSPSFRGADRRSANPESIRPVSMAHDTQGLWVPGSALTRRPGTTGNSGRALT
ncbi:glycosyltransferase family 39 protein [Rhodoplanes sp. TEM]|uniref:Glycosyltransferase family 39 protein n=1 Tax=Rhodoplanes tepidamans TaxID=200616 RepID=A0ABT5J9I4_RHOTP|nr:MULTISPECIES: glycosyltransferase family 39 protein [Rhodoplanes]MDC7786142.1 glycosyltransferase family 39 protein [Rhodoplanes tepidamans]MDC7982809.1 glycosyltransferase family 39 protein [Rhodoplanes sp. TEM]MDQ0357193.1 4-amino-4-deoxy-L-arabinose transferase-like glycosyltransferase [Rhodoplanes tepidamans]